MPQLRALLFDVDGTLAETERDGHRLAFNQAFADFGLDWNWDEKLYGELLSVTGGRERIADYAAKHQRHWLGTPASPLLIAKLHARKNALYARMVDSGGVALRSGLEALLRDALAAGLRLAIVTTTSRDNLDALLRACFDEPLRRAFEVRVVGEDVAVKKPHPECYERALSRMGLTANEALAVEDSPNGLRSASAAGLRTLVVRSHYFRDHDFCGAFAVVDEFDQITLADLQRTFEQSTGR